MYVKIHSSGPRFQNRIVIAVCDESLLGKTLKGKTTTITATEQFYKGDRMSRKKVIEILKDAVNCNLLGKEAVEAGIAAGIIDKKSVIVIGGEPHAQCIAA